jgi:hypothetical protein
MQEIMAIKRERAQRLAGHPFYAWLQGTSVPTARKLLFAPIMVNFVMNFRDMNKWFLRFPPSQDRFKNRPRQQNSWVIGGSGRPPRL